jgi:type IV pilus assembly protein PilO
MKQSFQFSDQLSLSSLEKLSLREKAAIVGLAAVILIYGYIQMVYSAQQTKLEAMKSQLLQKKTALHSFRDEMQRHPDQALYQAELIKQQNRVNAMLPSVDAVSEILVMLNTLAKEQQVKIVSIKQGMYVDKKIYYEIPLEINVKCTYTNLLKFIRKMETLERFNSITRISVQPVQEVLHVQLNTSVYVFGSMPQKADRK